MSGPGMACRVTGRSGPMPSGFHHLTGSVRCRIRILKDGGPCRRTARDLKLAPSTVSRDLRRNDGPDGYCPKAAQDQADSRHHTASPVARKLTLELWAPIERWLTAEQWSPERISGRLSSEGLRM